MINDLDLIVRSFSMVSNHWIVKIEAYDRYLQSFLKEMYDAGTKYTKWASSMLKPQDGGHRRSWLLFFCLLSPNMN